MANVTIELRNNNFHTGSHKNSPFKVKMYSTFENKI